MATEKKKPLGRELWLMALNDGKAEYPPPRLVYEVPVGRKTSTEHFRNVLRKPRLNSHGKANKKRSFTNLTPRSSVSQERAFLSTPNYLRMEMMCPINAVGPGANGIVKPPNSGRSSALKQPEEYADEVFDLKKRVIHLAGENDFLKAKFRRCEEESNKKDKLLESLTDPTKGELVFGGTRTEGLLAINNLRQKVYKLENQLREKDTSFLELKSQLKYTKMDEMKIQLEVLYMEVLRLRSSGPAEIQYAAEEMQKTPTDSAVETGKQEALMKAVKRLNEEKVQLAAENKHLREEMDALLQERGQKGKKKDRHGSLSSLRKSSDVEEKPPSSATRRGTKTDVKHEVEKVDTENKITLEGNLRERLDALDKRESQLMQEVETLNRKITRLQEDRDLYKKKYTEKCEEVKELNALVGRLKKEKGIAGGDLPPRPENAKNRKHMEDAKHKDWEDDSISSPRSRRRHTESDDEQHINLIQSSLKGFLKREKRLKQETQREAEELHTRPRSSLQKKKATTRSSYRSSSESSISDDDSDDDHNDDDKDVYDKGRFTRPSTSSSHLTGRRSVSSRSSLREGVRVY